MKKEQKDWEYDSIFGDRQPGDIRKEHIIYRRVGNKIHRIKITRLYMREDDYQDSTETIVL